MYLPKNPLLRALSVLVLLIGGVFGVGYMLVMLLLISVSLQDPSRREAIAISSAPDTQYRTRTQTSDIYLRNRTTASLQVHLVAARAAVPLDSAWWSLPLMPEAIGRGLILRDGFTTRGLHYQLARPALVLGTADTVVDMHYPDPLPRALIRCRRLDIRHTNELPKNGFIPDEPVFERVIRVQRLLSEPDSLHLTLYLEPGDSLALGCCRVGYDASNSPSIAPSTATVQASEVPPSIDVQWQDAQHHLHQHHPRLTGWLKATAQVIPLTGSQQVRHYLDYPLNYTTVITR